MIRYHHQSLSHDAQDTLTSEGGFGIDAAVGLRMASCTFSRAAPACVFRLQTFVVMMNCIIMVLVIGDSKRAYKRDGSATWLYITACIIRLDLRILWGHQTPKSL